MDILITSNFSILHAVMYGMIMEPSKPGTQHVAQQTKISPLAKGLYRGPSNIKPSNVRGRSNSYSIKPSTLFKAGLRHLIFGLLLVTCFPWIPKTWMSMYPKHHLQYNCIGDLLDMSQNYHLSRSINNLVFQCHLSVMLTDFHVNP